MESPEIKEEAENNNSETAKENENNEDVNENFIKGKSIIIVNNDKIPENKEDKSKENENLETEVDKDTNSNKEKVINLDDNVMPSTHITDLDEVNEENCVETDVMKYQNANIINDKKRVDLSLGENIFHENKLKIEEVVFRDNKDKSKNKEKRVTFVEYNIEDEENNLNLLSAKSDEAKVVWEIVSETKQDDIVTEVQNERETDKKGGECDVAQEIWRDYEKLDKEDGSSRDKSVFLNCLEERQSQRALSVSDFNNKVNDFSTMTTQCDESTGISMAHVLPTRSDHMCGSLFARCGSVRTEPLVQTFSHPYDTYSGPVSLTEILQERDNTWGTIGGKPDRMCKYEELDEELDNLEHVLMGNGASTNPFRNNEAKNGYGVCSVDCNKKGGVDPVSATTDTYEYVRSGVMSLMKRETKEWENKAVDLNNEVVSLQQELKSKEQEILRLQREVHKLKSVLQQATSFSNDGDLLSSLQEIHGMAGQKKGTGNKKQGVSAESSQPNKTATDIHIQRYEKDFRSKQLIKAAIMDNDFLKNLDLIQVRELVESMYPKECSKGSYVIREGEAGSHLYVAAEGEFEVIKENKVLGIIGPGKAFGELAILYNCTRTASIRVIKNSKVWVLDRRVFQRIMMQTGLQRLEENIKFLRSVPLLKNLADDVLTKISDVLEVEFYPSGHHIVRQGANGDTFFILSQGRVKVTQRLQGATEDQEIRILERGDYFGEQALLKEDCRTASVIALPPGVECLTLDRESFIQLIGDLSELQEKDYGDRTRLSFDRPPSSNSIHSETDQELAHIRLEDLDVIATLGVGGFGRVELVQCLCDRSKTFALKCLKKQHIVETHQQEHVYSEKNIMMSCRHPFICRLYRTFKDTKYVYMLIEACLGGEVWTILRDRGCFDDNTCCFIVACVIEALHYLHSRGIVFRDLKPENLLLDSQGYVKLVDFGFAKRLGASSKTWTFCGTPEYVAPEVILNKGHDKAVDCWALGILIHELLTGAPPFSGSDPMKVYNMILKGIDMIDFPRHVTRTAQALIKKLCRDSPTERLGCQKGGLADIKKNKWFQGFDWDGLRQRTLLPPIVPQIHSPTDTTNFDQYPKEMHIPEDETSDWDADF